MVNVQDILEYNSNKKPGKKPPRDCTDGSVAMDKCAAKAYTETGA